MTMRRLSSLSRALLRAKSCLRSLTNLRKFRIISRFGLLLTYPHRVPKSKYPMLQQSITLTGLGTDQFEDSINGLIQMYALFERQFTEGRVIPWQPTPCSLSAGRAVVLGNRYFTRRSEALQMKSLPF